MHWRSLIQPVLAENSHPFNDQRPGWNSSFGGVSQKRINEGFRPFENCCDCVDAAKGPVRCYLTGLSWPKTVVRSKTCWSTQVTRTNHQLNTPFKNPIEEVVTEVEVTDRTHPLFGRRFPILSITTPRQGSGGYVLVSYREGMTLRISLLATSLAPSQPAGQTKLTLNALSDLISLAEQCEVLCTANPQKSGSDCLPSSKPKSSTTCRRSSRR